MSLVLIVSALALQPLGLVQSLVRPTYAKALAPPPPLTVHPDFNGDGYADLAIGVPHEELAGLPGAGMVNVLYGSVSGLAATGNQMWQQDSNLGGVEVQGLAEDGDAFGDALATGDFNNDGYSDLAIGVPYEDVGGHADAGAVNVLYGSASGLTATGNQLWHQDSANIESAPNGHEKFGAALVAGDFNNDGRDDLAIGVPGDKVNAVNLAGAVNILYGSATGLSATANQLWSQESPSLAGVSESGEQFGATLAVGDFNNDGRDDLAIGVPKETVGGLTDAGAVNVLYGSAAGLSATGNQLWHQDSSLAGVDVIGMAEAGDFFGSTLAAGDFNNDGRADLAIGVPGEEVNGIVGAGAVNALYGAASGLVATGNQAWHQDSPQVENSLGTLDKFGLALAAGDFNNDGRSDLAIGVPGETVSGFTTAGAVNVLYGSATGLSATGNQLWHQDIVIANVPVVGVAQTNDYFGAALATGDFNNDGRDDLAIGVPKEDVDGVSDAGAINVLFGTASGLSVTGNQMWHQNSQPGGVPIAGSAQTADRFGSALGAQ